MGVANTSNMHKTGSHSTLQSVYTDAYSTLEFYDTKTHNLVDGVPPLYPPEYNNCDDLKSVYQQSLHSNNPDRHLHSNNNQRANQTNLYSTMSNNQHCGKEDTESFIYNDDMNSVDIMNINEHRLQRKNSNSGAQKNNNNNNSNNNDFDFLDNQSIATMLTSYEPYNMLSSKSPTTKRQTYTPNNISTSPTYSKVRQVSQKIFQNYNSNGANGNPINGTHNIPKAFKGTANRKTAQHPNLLYGLDDGFGYCGNSVLNDDMDEVINEKPHNDLNQIDDHTGLTDAESFLAKPYRTKKKHSLYNIHPDRILKSNGSNPKFHYDGRSINNSTNDHHQVMNELSALKRNSNLNPGTKNYSSIGCTYFDIHEDCSSEMSLRTNNNSPHDYKSMYYRQNIFLNFILNAIYVFVLLLILFSFLKIVIMQNFDNPLSNFEVSDLENVLMSNEVLLMDIISKSSNTNFQDISVWDMDLDVFLVTDESNILIEADIDTTDITILLGNSNRFLTPLKFSGLFNLPTWSEVWHSWRNTEFIRPMKSIAQLKIYQPGKKFTYQGKPLSHDQWTQILNSTYKIILRGNLKYSLPLVWQDQFISISTEVEIKPS